MAKKVIQARNVVDYSTGTVVHKATDAPVVTPVEPVKETPAVTPLEPAKETPKTVKVTPKVVRVKTAADIEADQILESVREVRSLADEELEEAKLSDELVSRPAPTPDEPLETKPLTMRTSKYLDETPQDPDWADEEAPLETEEEAPVSTFAEVFIPLHDDSTGAIIRKGMVIVSVIVILCCLVAILMKRGQVSGVMTFNIPELTAQAQVVAAAVSSLLL